MKDRTVAGELENLVSDLRTANRRLMWIDVPSRFDDELNQASFGLCAVLDLLQAIAKETKGQ